MLRCAYFSEELEQWMTDGVTLETVQDGRSSVLSHSFDSFDFECLQQPVS